MGLVIGSEEADRLARELAAATGESIATAVTIALQERLSRVKRPDVPTRRAALREIRARASKLPVLDDRSDDDLLGYNEFGTFVSLTLTPPPPAARRQPAGCRRRSGRG